MRSRLHCAGHLERMDGVRLTKRAMALGVENRRRRGRPGLSWDDLCEERLSGRRMKNEGKG